MRITTLFCCLLIAAPLSAADISYLGIAPGGARIEAISIPGGSSKSPTVVLIGGMNGSDESTNLVRQELRAYEATKPAQRRFRLIAIPVANPEKDPGAECAGRRS